MRFLIISDIHCVSRELSKLNGGYHGSTGSDFFIEERSSTKNPIFAIEAALKDANMQVDAILCLGDFAHQSKQLPFLQVWRDIHDLAAVLDVKEVYGITGNHDILSRAEDVQDASVRLDFLKSVRPAFPHSNDAFRADYFQDGVASAELGDCCLIAIDTCRAHGLGGDAEQTKGIWEVGLVTADMQEKILRIASESEKDHILVIMHHHPIKVDELEDIYPDAMEDGAQFLKALGDTGKKCLLVHGHKHQVHLKITELGTAYSPIVFSAATFSARPYPTQINGFYNLFHIIDFDTSETTFPAGEIFSWSWSGTSWVKSKHDLMPFHVPFGREVDVIALAKELAELNLPATGTLRAEALFDECQNLKFFRITELEALNKELAPHGRVILPLNSKIHAMMEI
ncbi:MAG: hypothetical protein CSB47_04505 [Proteobacteria bacterium]|nr:MAG: hypothetical protein CSB47_04505 [Pseudomonadota bacterium]